MKISGIPPLPPAAHGRGAARPQAAEVVDTPPAPAPVPASETTEAAATAESAGKAHGLVRAAEHSNRSDVAALRQWINHPELRDSLPLPDLSAEHKGNGFARAVAAYEAVIAIGNPDPATDPVVTDPVVDPVPTDPVATDPVVDPVPTDPVATDPVATDPVVTDPLLSDTAPGSDAVDPDPVLSD